MASNRGYSLSLVEPHPSAPYTHTARGGAGNITRTSTSKATRTTSTSTTTSTSPTTLTNRTPVAPKTSNRQFASGRGGVGNMHHISERAIFAFDEELERQMRQQKDLAPVYHVGRGGAGNMVYLDGSTRHTSTRALKGSDSGSQHSGSSDGDDSIDGVADRVPGTVKRGIGRGWKKIVGVGDYMTG